METKKKNNVITCCTILVLIFAIFILLGVAIWYFVFSGGKNKSASTNTNTAPTQSAAELQQYDNKIYDITLDGANGKGIAGITVKNKRLLVWYHLLFNDAFAMNSTCHNDPCPGGVQGYTHIGNLLMPKSNPTSDPVGSFSAVYCNKDALSENAFESDKGTYQCPQPPASNTVTSTFNANFSKTFGSIDEFLAADGYEVYDASTAWVQESADTWYVDDAMAVKQGKKLKTYKLILTERK